MGNKIDPLENDLIHKKIESEVLRNKTYIYKIYRTQIAKWQK